MRVNTDSILLGAWSAPPLDARRALDVGTGTGILALMLAQRIPQLQITGIEIDAGACSDARANFASSIWHDRLEVVEGDVRQWRPAWPPDESLDLIISNPPFFSSHKEGLPSGRALARQQVALSMDDLIHLANQQLSPSGQMDLILPVDQAVRVTRLIHAKGLAVRRRCMVFPRPGRTANRVLMSISRVMDSLACEEITLRGHTGQEYSTAYCLLTKDYLLHPQDK